MSEIIAALNDLKRGNEDLARKIKAADPAEVGRRAEQGARAGAGDISAAAASLKQITQDMAPIRDYGLKAARMDEEARERRRWWKWALIVSLPLLGLLIGVVAGVLAAKGGVAIETQIGCEHLGGQWVHDTHGNLGCWKASR